MPKIRLFVHLGQRIGRGVVIDTDVRIPRPNRTSLRGARLVCDCGDEYVSALQALVGQRPDNQRTQSCGCLRREHQIAAATTHGLNAHPLAKTWDGMIRRCEDPQAKSYADYGGRGISVCPEWRDIAVFTAWIDANLGARPDGFTLNRIDNDGNYEPGNVEWATWEGQAANRRPRAPQGPRGADPRPYVITCAQCGGEFRAARSAAQFCSKACKAAYRRAAGADNITLACHQCGTSFTVNRYDAVRHCSRTCAATCQHAGNCPAKEVV